MRLSRILILLLALILTHTTVTLAQNSQSAAQTAEQLRAQLRDVQAREVELRGRLQQLDVDLKPENIERYFAAVGSTRPEELREIRRRQLQNEKDGVTAELAQLATSRVRLESAVSIADAEAYHQSAQGDSAGGLGQMMGSPSVANTRLLVVVLTLIAIVGALALVAVIRRRRRIDRTRFTAP